MKRAKRGWSVAWCVLSRFEEHRFVTSFKNLLGNLGNLAVFLLVSATPLTSLTVTDVNTHCSSPTEPRFGIFVMNLLGINTYEGATTRARMHIILLVASLLRMEVITGFLIAPLISRRPRMTVVHRLAEEKKDDGVLYWKPTFTEVNLPAFSRPPKMIVFDKDVRRMNESCCLFCLHRTHANLHISCHHHCIH